MKKTHLIKGAVVVGVLALTAGGMAAANAASGRASGHMFNSNGARVVKALWPGGLSGELKTPLTDAQKADLQTKEAAIKAAIDANDYNAWVTAVTAVNPNSPLLKKITASNFATLVANYKKRETAVSDLQTKEAAVKAAIDANDYNAWVAAVKNINSSAPILTKITSSNFSTYVSAVKLEEQANATFQSLGIKGQGMGWKGMGMMMGGLGRF